MIREQRGFTLVELLIVMAIFTIVIMVTTRSFETILNHAGQQGKSAQSQIEGIVGLEMFRSDLEQAGFGLPWSFLDAPAGSAYTEVSAGANEPVAFQAPIDSATFFNDGPTDPPRAILNGSTKFNLDSAGIGAQYLVIKSAVIGLDPAARKWTTKTYTESASTPPTTWGQDDRDLNADDRVVIVQTSFMENRISTQRLMVKGGQFSTTFGKYSSMSTPHTHGDVFHIYGIDKPAGTALRMPFNRADYYIKRPANIPLTCAPNTGVLYKAVASHADGSLSPEMPLLDCVADMQVVYGLDTDEGGRINFHQTTPPDKATNDDNQAETIRKQVKEVKVFILTQEGKRDRTYSYPNKTIRVGDASGGRDFDLEARIGPDYRNYRWKVYTIVVRPKNLIQ